MKWKGILVLVLAFSATSFLLGDERERFVARSLFEEGVYSFNQRDYSASASAFLRALTADPSYHQARYWLGKAYFQGGYVQNALREWEYFQNALGEDLALENRLERFFYQNSIQEGTEEDLKESYLPTKSLSRRALYRIESPVSIWIDSANSYFVVDYGSKKIFRLGRNGELLETLTDSKWLRPFDLVRNSKGEFWISDFEKDQIHQYSRDRTYIQSIGRSGVQSLEFYGPQGITVDSEDRVYIVDRGNHRVQKLDSKGQFLMLFGEEGRSDSELMNPSDIIVLGDRIYVSDTGNSRVQVFDLSGNWIESLGEGYLVEPRGLALNGNQNILVADRQKGIFTVSLKNREWSLLKSQDESFLQPLDTAIDQNQFLYGVDIEQGEVLTFVPESFKYNHLSLSIIESFFAGFNGKSWLRENLGFLFQEKERPVQHRILVSDAKGKPIDGLKKENFQVTEIIRGRSYPLQNIEVFPEAEIPKALSLVVLRENSMELEGQKDRLESLSRKFLSSLDSKDRVEVLSFGRDYSVLQGFVQSELSPLYAILSGALEKQDKEQKKPKAESVQLGEVLYRAIGDAYRDSQFHGAVLILSSAELLEESIDPYPLDVLVNYARNNQVPIYVLEFREQMKESQPELLLLAEKTGGQYLNAYRSRKAQRIVASIKEASKSIYSIRYLTPSTTSQNQRWRNLRIQVHWNELFGEDRSGYFFR